MKYGTIAGNVSINETIYRCFGYIGEGDAKAFVKKFDEQRKDTQHQIMHTFRELILGAFLASCGRNVSYELQIGGMTPDWSVLGADEKPSCIVELTNFHTDKVTEDEIAQCWRENRPWRGPIRSHVERLDDRIKKKASKYKKLVQQAQVGYIVAVFGEFTANVRFPEIEECLFAKEVGIFPGYPEMSGLLFFIDHGGKYRFRYVRNPQAVIPHEMPSYAEF